jgi:hypothetical protein
MFGEQYPHIATISVAGNSTKDGNGDFVAGPVTQTTYKCRAEVLRGGGFVQMADGTRADFSWLVYMAPITGIIQAGSKIQVRDNDGNFITQGTVVRFLKSDFNCRTWLV